MSSKSKSIKDLSEKCRFTHCPDHGITVAAFLNGSTVFLSIAFTRLALDTGGPSDQFSRARGRQIAVGRINKTLTEPFRCRKDMPIVSFDVSRMNPVLDDSGQPRPVTAALVMQETRSFIEDYVQTHGDNFIRSELLPAIVDYLTF